LEVVREIGEKSVSSDREKVNNAFMGITLFLALCESGKIENQSQEVLTPIIQCIKWRRHPDLISAMDELQVIISKMPNSITETQINDVIIGLGYLLEETRQFQDNSYLDTNDRLYCRKVAASLAYELYCWFTQRQKLIPDEIEKWKQVCLDQEEFPEIRKQWIL
jgi:hypothetical protein